MPKMHLGSPISAHSACGSFIKNKERMEKLSEIGDSQYTYQNELNRACSQHDMIYGEK